MRTIVKGREPASLTKYRQTEGADYEGYRDKGDLRMSLVAEQRGLCCYCLCRIRHDAVKIEHWRCQKDHEVEQLSYSNLLGACLGGPGEPQRQQHCDTRKGDRDLSRNPANPADRVEDLLHFLGDGRIESSDRQFDHEINEVLNLNQPLLVSNRKQLLEAFKQALPKLGALSRSGLLKMLDDWNGTSHDRELRPYCQVIVYWLKKRLARA